jgi:hypothetical protein
MRPELHGIEANDIPDWPDWSPAAADDELQSFTLAIGWPGGTGADNFQVAVASPAALRIRSHKGKFVGLEVDRFEPELVERAIQEFVASCDALTWEGAVELLQTRMRWEYDGYRG